MEKGNKKCYIQSDKKGLLVSRTMGINFYTNDIAEGRLGAYETPMQFDSLQQALKFLAANTSSHSNGDYVTRLTDSQVNVIMGMAISRNSEVTGVAYA